MRRQPDLLAEALDGFASVCVNPNWVALAANCRRSRIQGSATNSSSAAWTARNPHRSLTDAYSGLRAVAL